MKNTLISILLTLAFLSLSQTGIAAGETATPGAAPATSQGDIRKYEQEFSGVKDFARISKDLNANSKSIQYDKDSKMLINWIKAKGKEYKLCKQFFSDASGKLGPYGTAMASLIADDLARNERDSVFYKPNPDTKISCPGFDKMTPMQKVAFHTWVWELTALPESSCNLEIKDNISGDVPRGQAVCMYQLEYAKADREWRSSSPSKTNAKGKDGRPIKYCAVPESEIRTLAGCTGCAFDDYKRHFMATGYLFGEWNDDPKPKRLHAAQWAAHTRLTPKLKADVAAYEKCREAKKCKSELLLNEKIAAKQFFERLERFPLCETEAAKIERASIQE
jgi:hypothetical protein